MPRIEPNTTQPVETDRDDKQVLYIDGCKVTIRYSDQENPLAVRQIRNALISSISTKKT